MRRFATSLAVFAAVAASPAYLGCKPEQAKPAGGAGGAGGSSASTTAPAGGGDDGGRGGGRDGGSGGGSSASGAPAAAGSTPATGADRGAGLELPDVPAARALAPPRPTPDGDALMIAWCFEGHSAAESEAQLRAALTASGFERVTARGSGARRAISGTRGEHRISVVLGGVDQRCPGVLASATIVEVGRFAPPPIEPGDRIR